MPRVQPSAEGAELALGLDLESQRVFLRAAQGADGRTAHSSGSLSAFETGRALKTRFSHLPESLRERNCPQAEPELLTPPPEGAAASVYSASL